MTNAVAPSVDVLAGARREFQTRVLVKMGFVESDQL
jgi:hypothetical protein